MSFFAAQLFALAVWPFAPLTAVSLTGIMVFDRIDIGE